MNITIWKRKKYYYNILREKMTTFIIRLVAILYRLLMAIIMAHLNRSLVPTIVTKVQFEHR